MNDQIHERMLHTIDKLCVDHNIIMFPLIFLQIRRILSEIILRASSCQIHIYNSLPVQNIIFIQVSISDVAKKEPL